MILNARISNGFTTSDGLTFTNGESTMVTVGGGGNVDGYPVTRPSIVLDPVDSSRNVLKFTSTCPTDTYSPNITRSQVDLVSPSWIKTLTEKWLLWDIYVPSATVNSGHMVAILSIYSNNSGAPAIRPGCFHAFIGDGSNDVPVGMVGFRSNTSAWYPRLVVNVPSEKFLDRWVEIVVNIDLEGTNKDGCVHIWLDGELIYSAVRVNTVYTDTVDVHYKPGGVYFWETSPSNGEWYSYSAGMVIGDSEFKTFNQFASAANARTQQSKSGEYSGNPSISFSGKDYGKN